MPECEVTSQGLVPSARHTRRQWLLVGVRTSKLSGWQGSGGHDLFFSSEGRVGAVEGDKEKRLKAGQKKKNTG